MPIDPSIALQVRPIQIEAPDPIKTLLTVAQLRGMQADQDLKQLQMADLAGKLQTYQALNRPGGPLSQLAYGSQPDQGQAPMQPSPLRSRPGVGPGVLGGGAPMGGGAPPGQMGGPLQGPTSTGSTLDMPQARPVTQEERAAIGQGGQAGLSPQDQAKYDEIRARSQEAPYVPQSSPASVPTAGFAPYRGLGGQEAPLSRSDPGYQGPMMWRNPDGSLTQGWQGPPPPTTEQLQQQMQEIERNRQLSRGDPGYAGPVIGRTPEQQAADQENIQRQLGQTQPGQAPIPQPAGAVQPSPLARRGTGQPPFQGATTPPQAPPQATPGAQDPSQPGVGPNALTRPQGQGQLNPVADVDRRLRLYGELAASGRPDVTLPIVQNFMALDKHGLELKEGVLKGQATAMGMIAQGMDGVLSLPEADRPQAYAQMRQMFIQMGVPNAQQLSAQYVPQEVTTYATQARTAQQRAEEQIKLLEEANKTFDNKTKRFKEEVSARETVTVQTPTGQELRYKYGGGLVGTTGLSPESMSKLTEQERLELDRQKMQGEVDWAQDETGAWVPRPKFLSPQVVQGNTGATAGAPGTGGMQFGQPLINPVTKQPYLSLDARKFRTEKEQTAYAQYKELMQPYINVTNAIGRIEKAGEKATPMGDFALAYAYIKMLDDQTGVRDSETRAAAAAGGLPAQIQTWIERFKGNQMLPDTIREDIKQRANGLYDQYMKDYESRRQELRGVYTRQGLNADNIAIDFRSTTRTQPSTGPKSTFTPAQIEQIVQEELRRQQADPNRPKRSRDDIVNDLQTGAYGRKAR